MFAVCFTEDNPSTDVKRKKKKGINDFYTKEKKKLSQNRF